MHCISPLRCMSRCMLGCSLAVEFGPLCLRPPLSLKLALSRRGWSRQVLGAAGKRTSYPLAAVVGQEDIKSALLLGAVDPMIGGIAISGKRGTAKSIMARGLHELMPPIDTVSESYCNADPEQPGVRAASCMPSHLAEPQ